MIYLHTRGAFFFEPLERASVALLLKDRAELGEHLIVCLLYTSDAADE